MSKSWRAMRIASAASSASTVASNLMQDGADRQTVIVRVLTCHDHNGFASVDAVAQRREVLRCDAGHGSIAICCTAPVLNSTTSSLLPPLSRT